MDVSKKIKERVPESKISVEKSRDDARNYRVSFAKATKILNFSSKWTLEEGIEQVVDKFSKNEIGDYSSTKYSNVMHLSESGRDLLGSLEYSGWEKELLEAQVWFKVKLSKVVIPIAGLGTRMLPATKAIPKEILPLVKKPIIQIIVEEIVNAGFKEIVLITHSSKSSVENHFDSSYELEATLEKRLKRSLLKEIRIISNLDVSIQSVRQGYALGLGHAILCSKPIIQKEPFAVVLPDMILGESSKINNLSKLKEEFERPHISQILLGKIPIKEVIFFSSE